MHPIPFLLRQLGRFLAHVFRRFNQDRCLQIASSLTFTTLLALVPLVTITLGLMAAFPVFSGLGEHIHAFLLANMLPEKAGKVVTGYIEQFSGQAGRLTALGTADRKSTRLNSSHSQISYAVFCLKKKKQKYYGNSHQQNRDAVNSAEPGERIANTQPEHVPATTKYFKQCRSQCDNCRYHTLPARSLQH